jgi:hypothetical protein
MPSTGLFQSQSICEDVVYFQLDIKRPRRNAMLREAGYEIALVGKAHCRALCDELMLRTATKFSYWGWVNERA